MNISRYFLAGIALTLASSGFAQTTSDPSQGSGRRGPHGHPPSPLVRVLDANKDGVISADEIANASAALLTLDTNGDGALSADELCPPRPADAPTPPADAKEHRPADPVMLALDADGDGALSASEIANAPASLKALDTNKDGQLTRDELRPLPPAE